MEVIKKTILIFFICQMAYTQKLTPKEKECFLVGMFNYAGGNLYIPNHPVLKNRLNYQFKNKEKLITVFSDTLKKYCEEKNIEYEIKDNGFIEFYTYKNKNFETYFIKNKSNKGGYYDEKLNQDFEIFYLDLDKKVKLTEKEKLYFLLGSFINCGKYIDEKECYFHYPNTYYIDFIIKQLKDLNIKINKIECFKERTPSSKKKYFTPSTELSKLLIQNKNLWD